MSRNLLTMNMQMCRNINLKSQEVTLRKHVIKVVWLMIKNTK